MAKHYFGVLLTICFFCVAPIPVFAGGTEDHVAAGTSSGPASPRPHPIQEKKIYTNDDIDALAGRYGGGVALQPGALRPTMANAASSIANQRLGVSPDAQSAELESMTHEKDPRWYVKQIVALDAELEETDSKVQQLREFRATGTGLPVGLILSAPCEGITTDNEIEQLALRRQQLERQIGELDDTARRNGFSPGFLRDAPELAQELQSSVPLTPEQEQAVLMGQLRRLGRELVLVQGAVEGMRSEAGARGITLLPYAPETGGSPTADFLQRMDARASVLKSQIGAAEDDARLAGVIPSSLP